MPLSPSLQARLDAIPRVALGAGHTAVEPLTRFAAGAGLSHQISIKRDDTIPFGCGGNKVRKLRFVMAALLADGVDTVITCGGVQSNHARATAAAAAAHGLRCHIVVNGTPPARATGNALLNTLFGATLEHVASREERIPAMDAAHRRLQATGARPAIVPLGASTPLGALGFVEAVRELVAQDAVPDVIVHASSSGGTSAGLLAGVALHGLPTRVVGISADDPPAAIRATVDAIVRGIGRLLDTEGDTLADAVRHEYDDTFVGDGYGAMTAASVEAQQLLARHEAILVDHTYSAKALAGLLAYCRDGRIARDTRVLFWHTGGQIALFA
jgi:L-cysteate sulfo-lyase